MAVLHLGICNFPASLFQYLLYVYCKVKMTFKNLKSGKNGHFKGHLIIQMMCFFLTSIYMK